MAPLMFESEVKYVREKQIEVNPQNRFQTEIVWKNVLLIGAIHVGAIYGSYLMVVSAKYQTVYAWYLFCLFSGKVI